MLCVLWAYKISSFLLLLLIVFSSYVIVELRKIGLGCLRCLFRLLKGIWHCQRKFWVKIFVITIFELITLFFHAIFGWLSLLSFSFPFSSPFSLPNPTSFHGGFWGRKRFLLFTGFSFPSNEWYVLNWKHILSHNKACLFCWIIFSGELMSAINLWRPHHINEIVFLNFLL